MRVQIQEFMLDLVPEATKGPQDGRSTDHMGLVLSIVYNSTELSLADIQRALAASKPSDEVCTMPITCCVSRRAEMKRGYLAFVRSRLICGDICGPKPSPEVCCPELQVPWFAGPPAGDQCFLQQRFFCRFISQHALVT